jgi:hypothetical protein
MENYCACQGLWSLLVVSPDLSRVVWPSGLAIHTSENGMSVHSYMLCIVSVPVCRRWVSAAGPAAISTLNCDVQGIN